MTIDSLNIVYLILIIELNTAYNMEKTVRKGSVSRHYSNDPRRKRRVKTGENDSDIEYVRCTTYLDRDLVELLELMRLTFGVGMSRNDLIRLILTDSVGKFVELYGKVKLGELKVVRDLWNDTFAFMDREQYEKYFGKNADKDAV